MISDSEIINLKDKHNVTGQNLEIASHKNASGLYIRIKTLHVAKN